MSIVGMAARKHGYGDQSFQVPLPRLYGIAIDKKASVEASLFM